MMGINDAHSKGQSPSTGSVLVVEDDHAVRAVYDRILRASNLQVTQAADGDEAMTLVGRSPFDAILSDLVLPGLGGLDLLRYVRAVDQSVPFVIVTGRPETETVLRAAELGAHRYLLKPVQPDKLRDTVANAVASGRRGKQAEAINALENLSVTCPPVVRLPSGVVVGYAAELALAPRFSQELRLEREPAWASDDGELSTRACEKLASWLDRHPDESLVFLTISGDTLLGETLYSDANPLRRHAKRVVLRLPLHARLRHQAHRIAALRERKFLLGLSDVGAGYGDLSLLIELEPDFVWISKSLVAEAVREPAKRPLISSLTRLCRELRVASVGEGSITESEALWLHDAGVELVLMARAGNGESLANEDEGTDWRSGCRC